MSFLEKLGSGRLNRKNYILVVVLFGIAVFFLLNNVESDTLATNNDINKTGLLIICVLIGVIFNVLASIRRLHDLGKPGAYSILNFVPYLNFLLILYLAVAKGRSGSNEYGLPATGGLSIAKILNFKAFRRS